jgi:glycosyltransferase involved in cell wall biosynthesis
MSSMKVSVALATYNGAQYLADQLESFARQERLPDELVVSDDASTDTTLAVLEAFAQTAPFAVHIHRKPANSGYIRNFDSALSLCAGDVVFLSDQDDVWFPQKIAAAIAALDQHPGRLLFVNDAEIVDERLESLGMTTFAQVKARGESERAFTQGSCFALRRELLEWVLPLPDTYPFHDMWISDIANDLEAVLIDERPLQFFRRHSENTSALTMPRPGGRRRRLRALAAVMGEDGRSGLQKRAAMVAVRLDRLRAVSRSGRLGEDGAARTAKAVGYLARDLRAIEARQAVLRTPRLSRPPQVAIMLKEGDYSHFSGLRSALVDMVRK